MISEIGRIAGFFWDTLLAVFEHGLSLRSVFDQMYWVGVRSASTTVFTGLFVGAILAIQIHTQLRDFGAESFLGGVTTSVIIRNVGPVLIGFILSGKVGAFTSAELGTMSVTGQLTAMRCLGTDPLHYLVAPRLVAVVVSSFLLLIVGLVVAVFGGILISNIFLGIAAASYISKIADLLGPTSISIGIIKSFVFGAIIATVGCYHGYRATGGTLGVGAAVRRSSVQSLISIIITDYAISSFAVPLLGLWWSR